MIFNGFYPIDDPPKPTLNEREDYAVKVYEGLDQLQKAVIYKLLRDEGYNDYKAHEIRYREREKSK